MSPIAIPIAIIGAGPAGLVLARLLEVSNMPYVVFEKDHSAHWAEEHQSGGTLDIHPDQGQVALQKAGLMGEFRSLARYGVSNIIADAWGDVKANLSGEDEDDGPEIDRKDLRRLLLTSVPEDKIHWSHKVEKVARENNGTMSVYFHEGKAQGGFRLVVGADGAWSRVRKLITSKIPIYTGRLYFSSFISPGKPLHPAAVARAGTNNYLAFGEQQQIFLHHLSDGSYHLAVGFHRPESFTVEDGVLEDPLILWDKVLRQEFTEWSSDLTALIKSANGKFRVWPFYSMEPSKVAWEHVPGVTLVGDAVHLTVPTGDGANLAMLDALELAERIIQHGTNDLDTAVKSYEESMMSRAVKAVEKGQWFLSHFFNAQGVKEVLQAMGIAD